MNPADAGKIVTEYMKPVYGFALKRCGCIQDAEDLTQEICLRLYKGLLSSDQPDRIASYVWTVAHHTLANHYRKGASCSVGIPIDILSDTLISEHDTSADVLKSLEAAALRNEIAFLSTVQRKVVVAYYFEGKKQEEIARKLDIPVGTVKWHLFEAKKELKRGMDTVRTPSELKFNPIKFAVCGMSGSAGTKSSHDFFRSALAQNIAYDVRNEAKTINEIAQDLGVSPVYVENEIDHLAEYGFLIEKSGKYLINFLLDEPTTEILALKETMYRRAAELVAPEVFDRLAELDFGEYGVHCADTDSRLLTLTSDNPVDRNYILWSLVPYVLALGGEELIESEVSFEEAATRRPDGGHNIMYTSVIDSGVVFPEGYTEMKNWFGPCWNTYGKYTLWSIDSEWTDKGLGNPVEYQTEAHRALPLLARFEEGAELSGEEYAYLTELGYISVAGKPDELFKAAGRYVYIGGEKGRRRLLDIGGEVKRKYKKELDSVKEPFVRAVLDATPSHLRKMQRFGLQFIFFSDGWFLLHSLKHLINDGRLKLPSDEQKKSLITLLISE